MSSNDFTPKHYPFLVMLTAFAFGITVSNCCIPKSRSEPNYPTHNSGWTSYVEQGVRMRGSFVLHKTESTHNSDVKIRVEGIIPPATCAEAGTHQAQARALLVFSRVSDDREICRNWYAENEGRNLSADCGESLVEFGILGIGIRAINVKEEWVHFELSG